jgi:hypothetical protein
VEQTLGVTDADTILAIELTPFDELVDLRKQQDRDLPGWLLVTVPGERPLDRR